MTSRDLAQEVDRLTASLAEIRRTLAEWPEQLEDAAEASRRRLLRAGRAVSSVAGEVGGRAREGVDVLESGIEERPLLAVGLAFLLGMAVDRYLLR